MLLTTLAASGGSSDVKFRFSSSNFSSVTSSENSADSEEPEESDDSDDFGMGYMFELTRTVFSFIELMDSDNESYEENMIGIGITIDYSA